MTDSSDPKAPKGSRRKSSREPATIDLKATVIDEGGQQDKAWDDVKPEETIVPEAEDRPQETIGASEATLDSGMNADSIEAGAATDGLPPRDGEPRSAADGLPSQDGEPRSADELPPRDEESRSAADELPPQDGEPRPAPSASASAPERRTSPVALLGAGLLGGLVGAGLVYGLQLSQQTPSGQDDPRIARLEQRVNALGQPRPQNPDLSPIEGRLQALESAQNQLDQRLQEIQNTANGAASRAEEALNRPLPQPPAAQNEATLTDLSNRLSALENEVRTNAQDAAAAMNAAQALERRLVEQDQRQNERLASLSQQVTQNSRNVEAAGQTGTRVVLTERLSDALRSGAPYADVLDALRKTGTGAERLKALEPFAEKGAPTASAMLERFEPLEAQILRDQRAASGEWSDRVLRMLDKVVTVRPVNEPGDTGVPATLARIRQALGWGDVGAAAAAWSSLPEPARRISEGWGQQAAALAAAQQASRDLSAEALAALNRSTQ